MIWQTWFDWAGWHTVFIRLWWDFPLSRMTTNNRISPMKFCIIQVLPFLNNPKDLDLFYKMDIDIWDCFRMKKTPSYIQRNTVTYDMAMLISQDWSAFYRTRSVCLSELICHTSYLHKFCVTLLESGSDQDSPGRQLIYMHWGLKHWWLSDPLTKMGAFIVASVKKMGVWN